MRADTPGTKMKEITSASGIVCRAASSSAFATVAASTLQNDAFGTLVVVLVKAGAVWTVCRLKLTWRRRLTQ
eukprot:3130360-Pleurochrysis_carterae.AAC.4